MKKLLITLLKILFAVKPLKIFVLFVLTKITNRRSGLPDFVAEAVHGYKCEKAPWARSFTKVSDSRIAFVSVSGILMKGQPAFNESAVTGDFSYRTISADSAPAKLSLSRTMMDKRFASVDLNMVFPIKALKYLKGAGVIRAVAENHYSFYPYTAKTDRLINGSAKEVARKLRYEGADKVVVIPGCVLAEESALLIQRAIESEGIPTVSLSYTQSGVRRLKPPRTCLYEKGSVCRHKEYLNEKAQIHLLEFLLAQFDLAAKPGDVKKLVVGMPNSRLSKPDETEPESPKEFQKDLFK
ncbi:MAG: hypothetical protein KC649_02335 [Candidatus Omnitrophica bacterium]|nr:hypothetical protein [Candidatus Omnitrophota bacterium]